MTNQEVIRLIQKLPTMCEFADAYGDSIDSDAYYEAVNMAVSALEKQIPKKPVMGYVFGERVRKKIRKTNPERAESKTECCPVCGKTLGVSQFIKLQTGLRFGGNSHCERCGQAIDWDDE